MLFLTGTHALRGSRPPELPKDPRREGTDPERGAIPEASRPLKGAKLAGGDDNGPRDELRAFTVSERKSTDQNIILSNFQKQLSKTFFSDIKYYAQDKQATAVEISQMFTYLSQQSRNETQPKSEAEWQVSLILLTIEF